MGSLNPVKRPGYYGPGVDERNLIRFMRFGLPAPAALSKPGQIVGWTLAAGLSDGEVLFGFPTLPAAGDLAHFGDELGVLIRIDWTAGAYSGSASAEVGASIVAVMPVEAWSEALDFTVIAIGSAGAGPASTPLSLIVPPSVVSAGFPYDIPLTFG